MKFPENMASLSAHPIPQISQIGFVQKHIWNRIQNDRHYAQSNRLVLEHGNSQAPIKEEINNYINNDSTLGDGYE